MNLEMVDPAEVLSAAADLLVERGWVATLDLVPEMRPGANTLPTAVLSLTAGAAGPLMAVADHLGLPPGPVSIRVGSLHRWNAAPYCNLDLAVATLRDTAEGLRKAAVS